MCPGEKKRERERGREGGRVDKKKGEIDNTNKIKLKLNKIPKNEIKKSGRKMWDDG